MSVPKGASLPCLVLLLAMVGMHSGHRCIVSEGCDFCLSSCIFFKDIYHIIQVDFILKILIISAMIPFTNKTTFIGSENEVMSRSSLQMTIN